MIVPPEDDGLSLTIRPLYTDSPRLHQSKREFGKDGPHPSSFNVSPLGASRSRIPQLTVFNFSPSFLLELDTLASTNLHVGAQE
jgi:hypothetical protein